MELVRLPSISRLSPRVVRVLGHNPGKFTLQGTNVYLIGTGSRRLILDTGEGKTEFIESLKTLLTRDLKGEVSVSDVILTHWHNDHVGGIPSLLNLLKDLQPAAPPPKLHKRHGPRSTPPTAPCETETTARAESGGNPRISDAGFLDIIDEQEFRAEGATLKACFTPGHTDDHTSFWLKEEDGALFTGDMVLGAGTAVFEDLGSYLSSLRRVISQRSPSRLYPAHGPTVENGIEKFNEYIRHRQDREDQILRLMETPRSLSSEDPDSAWTPARIVTEIYQSYSPALHSAAARVVSLHLKKLQQDGKVDRIKFKGEEEGGLWKIR